MNIIEELRKQSLENLFNANSFSNCFEYWKDEINDALGNDYNFNHMLSLGDSLSNIFQSTRVSGRGQSTVSTGGYAWECLVAWYLNFLFIGSRGIAIKNSLAPKVVKNSLSVNYGTFKSNTESDIIVIVFPEQNNFSIDYNRLNIHDENGNDMPTIIRNRANIKNLINRLTSIHAEELEVGTIQCKTNWNDNAQIPMLWNMIYLSNGFNEGNISIGCEGSTINDFEKFTYSFVTVPSNRSDVYKATSTSVNRVRNLTGGNFWGKPTESQIAQSIKEIFNRNFSSAFSNSHRNTVNTIIQDYPQMLDIFKLT